MSSMSYPQGPRNSAKATWSLVLGIVSFVVCGCLAGIPAIILGFMARSDIKRQPGTLTGEGMALAGIILGFVNFGLSIVMIPILLAIAVPNFIEAKARAQASRVKADLRTLATAIEAFAIDYNEYPKAAKGADGANAGLSSGSQGFNIFTFANLDTVKSAGSQQGTLTTPIAYLTQLFPDPFAGPPGLPSVYGYYAAEKDWIIFSAGPDTTYDINPESDWKPGANPINPELIEKAYDPTNGAHSRGDIFRVSTGMR